MTTEEPAIEKAAENLMRLLDDNVLKNLIRVRSLDAPVVAEAEKLLSQRQAGFDDATKLARSKLETSLRDWVEATAEWLHRSSSK